MDQCWPAARKVPAQSFKDNIRNQWLYLNRDAFLQLFKKSYRRPWKDSVSISSFCFTLLEDGDLENHDVSGLSQDTLDTIEADSFWCMSKLLDGIQVNLILVHPRKAICT